LFHATVGSFMNLSPQYTSPVLACSNLNLLIEITVQLSSGVPAFRLDLQFEISGP